MTHRGDRESGGKKSDEELPGHRIQLDSFAGRQLAGRWPPDNVLLRRPPNLSRSWLGRLQDYWGTFAGARQMFPSSADTHPAALRSVLFLRALSRIRVR